MKRYRQTAWIGLGLMIAVTAASAQISPAKTKPIDTNQDKTQKMPPAKTTLPPAQAMPTREAITPAATKGPANTSPMTPTAANNIVNGSTLTKEQFRALPPSAFIQVQGRQLTKQAMLDQIKTRPPRASTMSSQQLTARLIELRTRFLQKQQAELKSRNDKVTAALAQRRSNEEAFTRSAQFLAIHNEAISLQSQYDRATPTEKTRLEARARELQRQLQNLKASSLR